MNTECPKCKGKGYIIIRGSMPWLARIKCSYCRGHGYVDFNNPFKEEGRC